MNVIQYLETTLLNPAAERAEIEKLCADAVDYGFPLVMVNPCFVAACKRMLPQSVRVGTVIDFPFGASGIESKAAQIRCAIDAGADDLDVVAGIDLIRQGEDARYFEMLCALREAVGDGRILKIIVETAYLTQDELVRATDLATRAGVDFVKTSTGYASRGASVEDIATMSRVTNAVAKGLGIKPCGVKASGGIHTLAQCEALIEAGAIRIGTSKAVAIAEEYHGKENVESVKKG